VGVLLLVGLLQFKDGPFIRPHPAVWRVILALGVAYQMALVLVVFQVLCSNQSKDNARQLFKFIDPTLGVPLPEKSYAENCGLTWEILVDQMDVFVIAHTFGWFCKALILRDYWLCWVISILFEIMEYSLAHQLPNFAECWWDHWILDVLVTNWLGIYIGMKTCEYFEMKHYSFRGFNEIKTYQGKLSRGLQQFSPHSWTKFEWGTTKTFSRFVSIIGIIIIETMCELNAFYLKYLLWIPVSSRLNLWRLLYFFFISLPAVREAYQYINDPQCKRLGMYAWIATANILTEALIIYKFSPGEFETPFPTEVKLFWACAISLLFGYALWKFALHKPTSKREKVE
jgi:phosphatidylserine synthase 2